MDISADRGNARNQKGNESLLRYHNKAKEKQDIMKLVNQQLIKNTNLKQLYNSIYQNPGTSRAQLSKDSHLSKTAVSSLVDELIARKFVYDSGTGGSTTVGQIGSTRLNSSHSGESRMPSSA